MSPDKLTEIGFSAEHANRLSVKLGERNIRSMGGLRFVLSGTLTSVYQEDNRGRRLLFQIDSVATSNTKIRERT